MKKTNRVIMVTVAILLTLVLLSTSLVSGIFAKYVITKDATTLVSLKKFGVKLAIQQGADYTTSGATVTGGAISDSSLTATVKVELIPGSDFKEIIKFVPSIDSLDGKATVNTNIKVKAEVVTVFGNTHKYEGKYYVPAGFYVNNTQVSTPFISDTNYTTLKTTLTNNINNGLKVNGLGLAADATATNGFYSTQLVAANGDSVNVSKIGVGVVCPLTSNVADADAMITQLANQGATVEIKYTVSLEQG